MKMRGIRGAITVEANTQEAMLSATRELFQAIIEKNGIEEDDVASIFFSATPDLNAAFPAQAARQLGWTRTALLCFQEVDVPNAVPMCVRILMHWSTEKSLDEIEHVYLRGAAALRPDLQNK